MTPAAGGDAPDISVIVPTCDRPDSLRTCLERIFDGNDGMSGIEVIVSDDSRDTATRGMLEARLPKVRYHAGPRNGPGANRNSAARSARGRWLVFVDDDCLPVPGFLAAYRTAIAAGSDRGDTVLAGATIPIGPQQESLLWEAPENLDGRIPPPSSNFCLPAALFDASGGFDERFRYSFEDMEYFSRLRVAGADFRFIPEAAVEHPLRRIPGPAALARRWESRVIHLYDLGVPTRRIAWKLPRHILAVILSRFRDKRPARNAPTAACVFFCEFTLVLCQMPGWLIRYRKRPRSVFWGSQPADRLPPQSGL